MLTYGGPVHGGELVPLQLQGAPQMEGALSLAGRFLRDRGHGEELAIRDRHTLAYTRNGRSIHLRLVVGGFPAPAPRFVALTWGRAIHFRPVPLAAGPSPPDRMQHNSLFFHIRDGTPRSRRAMAALLVHELAHVDQQQRAPFGLCGFMAGYLAAWALVGFRYWTNPYEVAARVREQEALGYFDSLPGSQ